MIDGFRGCVQKSRMNLNIFIEIVQAESVQFRRWMIAQLNERFVFVRLMSTSTVNSCSFRLSRDISRDPVNTFYSFRRLLSSGRNQKKRITVTPSVLRPPQGNMEAGAKPACTCRLDETTVRYSNNDCRENSTDEVDTSEHFISTTWLIIDALSLAIENIVDKR